MNLLKAIEIRRSRRKFTGELIEPHTASALRELINEYNKAGNIRMELVINNGKAFNGFTKSYGMFSGVNDYICLIANENDHAAAERLGYYGELLVLQATTMGLSSCWVGGMYSRSDMPVKLSENESVVCAIIVGKSAEKESFKEKLIYSITHRKSKRSEEMLESDSPVPDWFMRGMEAVQKAPSAIHRQPVIFSYKNGKVSAYVKDISAPLMAFDFGIAKAHFELGTGGGTWEWGNNGEFTRHLDGSNGNGFVTHSPTKYFSTIKQ